MMAANFPGAFAGYSLEVTEAHQRTKADTSGTAKAVLGSFQQLGLQSREVWSYDGAAEPTVACSIAGRLHACRCTTPEQQVEAADFVRMAERALDGHA